MKYQDNGCFHSVTVSRAEVEAFKDTWPCSGLPDKAIWFQFDKRNGDLVDMSPSDIDGSAVLALSQDAKAWAEKRARALHPRLTPQGFETDPHSWRAYGD